jgi:hypothetical protein
MVCIGFEQELLLRHTVDLHNVQCRQKRVQLAVTCLDDFSHFAARVFTAPAVRGNTKNKKIESALEYALLLRKGKSDPATFEHTADIVQQLAFQ